MKRGLLGLVLFAAAISAFGLQVDREELNKGQGADVQFVNYVGPHTKIDTLAEIIGIGRELGAHLVADRPGEFTYYGRYRVIHVVSSQEPGKLDADIFIIEKSAEVDDVVNVMRMVAGYLEAAYSYTPADASLLARFVVYYNAVYRGDMKYIGATYKSVVTDHVNAENVGIARVYSEWPGNTRMLIPLTGEAGKGNLSSVGSDQLTTKKVIENLQQQPGKGIPQRKGITELKQREIVQGGQQVEKQKAQIAAEEKKIQQEQQGIQKQKAQVEQQKKSATTAEQKQQVAAGEAAIQQKQAAVEKQQKQVEQQKQSVAKQEQQLAERQQKVQKERQSIASDQRNLLQKQPPSKAQSAQPSTTSSAQPGEVLFVYDQEGTGDHLGRLVIIDRVSGKLKAGSTLNTIRGRAFERLPGAYVVVAGRSARGGSVRLVSLDPATLAMVAESEVAIAASSTMALDGTNLYAIAAEGGSYHLARFNVDLKKLAESPASVNPFTYITVSGNEVYVQDSEGNILILDKTDLKEKKRSGA